MGYLVGFNPSLIVNSVATDKMELCLDGILYIISGPLFQKYFIEVFDKYLVPKDIESIYKDISKGEKKEYSLLEYYKVIEKLSEKRILFIVENNGVIKQENYKISIKIVDYSTVGVGDILKSICENCSNYNIDISNEDTTELEASLGNENETMEIILVVSWSSDQIDWNQIGNCSNRLIIPIVCNYSYFSIGPLINGNLSAEYAKKVLDIEKRRYQYINYSPSCNYAVIMSAHLIQQLEYVITECLGGNYKSRIREEIMTYNMSADTLNIIRYTTL